MTHLKNCWYIGAWSNEVADKPLARMIANEPVVFYRNKQGVVGALEDRCPHRGVPLSLGTIVEDGLECGYHGIVFNCAGKCVKIPGQDHIPSRSHIRSFVVEERDETIWIWVGEAEKADPSTILDYPFNNDHKNWPHKYGMMPIEGHYMLVIDNLMDLTHLGFVHKKTIGSGPSKAYVDAIMNTERTSTGVKFTRWFLNHEPPETYKKAVGFTGNVDRWQEFEFVAPGNVVQFTGATNAGTGAYDKGERDGGFALRILHSITPATDTSCYYFFVPANGYRQDEPLATEQLFDEIERTFLEDKLFIEEQQRTISASGNRPLFDIVSDVARVQAQRFYNEQLEKTASGEKVPAKSAAAK